MKASSNYIGLAALSVAYAISLLYVIQHKVADEPTINDDRKVIRFGHWQLESGIRGAFDAVVREYEALNPEVRVEQLAIPDRAYPSWLRTQLVGETAPDLVLFGGVLKYDEELLARYFTPLTSKLEEPNPYNQGTDLEGMSWRNTFLDSLDNAYSVGLLDYYYAPAAMYTIRMHYNEQLWDKLLGDTPTPSDWDEFIEINQRVSENAYAQENAIMPLAGSGYNSNFILNGAMERVTQRLNAQLHRAPYTTAERSVIGSAWLDGDISLKHPSILLGLREKSRVMRFLPPGFYQLRRDDALFQFGQGRSLMLATGSWEAPSLMATVPFDVGVFLLPQPDPKKERFAAHAYGVSSEAKAASEAGGFVVLRSSANSDQAIDFLRFLTSKPGSSLFARKSSWMSPLRNIETPEETEIYKPVLDGYQHGFHLYFSGSNSRRVFRQRVNRLISGGAEAFAESSSDLFLDGVREDVVLESRVARQTAQRQDTTIASLHFLSSSSDDPGERKRWATRRNETMEAHIEQSINHAWMEETLYRYDRKKKEQ